jgi:hypothetical protein
MGGGAVNVSSPSPTLPRKRGREKQRLLPRKQGWEQIARAGRTPVTPARAALSPACGGEMERGNTALCSKGLTA